MISNGIRFEFDVGDSATDMVFGMVCTKDGNDVTKELEGFVRMKILSSGLQDAIRAEMRSRELLQSGMVSDE